MSFACDQCFDTHTIDRAGAEIACPFCSVAKYHPSSVTVKRRADGRWQAWDTSWNAAGVWYGVACNSEESARSYQRKRQGVIKAAITRRNNKKGNR